MTLRVHISLPVGDLKTSLAFYQRLFASPASKVRDDYANFRLEEPPIHLALNLRPDLAATDADRHHFGVELEDAESLAAWTARLGEGGDGLRIETDAECCYARADKTWVADPDGHEWELWVRTGESDRLSPANSGCCAPEGAEPTSCC